LVSYRTCSYMVEGGLSRVFEYPIYLQVIGIKMEQRS
jgi:hypothetical protein